MCVPEWLVSCSRTQLDMQNIRVKKEFPSFGSLSLSSGRSDTIATRRNVIKTRSAKQIDSSPRCDHEFYDVSHRWMFCFVLSSLTFSYYQINTSVKSNTYDAMKSRPKSKLSEMNASRLWWCALYMSHKCCNQYVPIAYALLSGVVKQMVFFWHAQAGRMRKKYGTSWHLLCICTAELNNRRNRNEKKGKNGIYGSERTSQLDIYFACGCSWHLPIWVSWSCVHMQEKTFVASWLVHQLHVCQYQRISIASQLLQNNVIIFHRRNGRPGTKIAVSRKMHSIKTAYCFSAMASTGIDERETNYERWTCEKMI